MTATYEANQWACPDNLSQLWRQSNGVHQVVDDPNTIPLDLATSCIHVITTKCGSDSAYCAWVLPYLDNALHNPTDQMTHNHFSFFWQEHNHPEYPYTKKTRQTFSMISILVSLVLSVLQMKYLHNLLLATH
jgi:hypothetical protein